MSPHAIIAVRAAQHIDQWGLNAAFRYVRNNGVPVRLFILAIALEYNLGA